MLIYNSLTDRKEKLKKPLFRKLKLFVCGPTVYDTPHIGNFRTFMVFDIIVRYLRSRGFKILYLQNITDVDDKIIARANAENVSWDIIARKYEKEFLETSMELGITAVDKYARATDHIAAIIRQVSTLIKKGYAYEIPDDGWYFDLSKFPEYGKLARRTLTQAEDGISRIDTSAKKRNAGDFCLWKFSKEHEPSWDAPFGNGRPGWHIEDTAITETFFGPQYDIHGGGIDLKFPHHEAEIVQQESASGKKPFVRFWMHVGSLRVHGQKMSKSLGNFVSIRELLQKTSPNEFRLLVFQHHYRMPLHFSEESVFTAQTNLSQISEFLGKLLLVSEKGSDSGNDCLEVCNRFTKAFHDAMNDDFNTPEAIGALHAFMNDIYGSLFSLSKKAALRAFRTLNATLLSVGFSDIMPKIPQEILEKAQKRELYRRNKQFTNADILRGEINALGYTIEDTPLGPFVKKKF